MDENKGIAKAELPFYGAMGFSVAAFVFLLLSFSCPYWMESYPSTQSPFLRMGLWSVCFDNYIHAWDQQGRVWSGCYWIFDRIFLPTGMWDWLNPRWLTAIQVLVTAAFIGQCAQMICMVLYFLYYGHPLAESAASLFFHAGSAFLLFIALTIFGVGYQSRTWQPRPDHTHLSWGYGFAVLSMIFSVLASGYLYCVARSDMELQQEYVMYENYENFVQQSGGVGLLSGQPSMFSAPQSVISVPSRSGVKKGYYGPPEGSIQGSMSVASEPYGSSTQKYPLP